MRILICFVLFSILIASCGTPSAPTKVLPPEAKLTDSTFFLPFKVKSFASDRGELRSKARGLYYQGVNSFKNDQNLDSAVFYFRSSIYQMPTSAAYFELGNAYKDQQRYDKALLAYQVAEALGYEPVGSLFIQTSRVYALMENESEAGDFLQIALQAGFTNFDGIASHPDYFNFVKTWSYKDAVNNGMRGMSNPEDLFWFQFKKGFAKMDLPFVLDSKLNAKDFENMPYITYDYEKFIPQMRDGKFSREVGVGYYFYGKAFENDQFVGLIYISKDDFYDESEPQTVPFTYVLSTFSNKGRLIDQKTIAGQAELGNEITVAQLTAGGTIEQSVFEQIYEKDTEKAGFINNKIVTKKLVWTKSLEVDVNGKINVLEMELGGL